MSFTFLETKGKTNEQKDRFARLSEIELEECKKKHGCKNTDKSQLWTFCVFEAWIENQCGSEPDDDQIRYKESDLYAEDAKRVCSMLCKFIVEARHWNGSPYSPKMLLQLAINLQSYALKVKAGSCWFMDIKLSISNHPFSQYITGLLFIIVELLIIKIKN